MEFKKGQRFLCKHEYLKDIELRILAVEEKYIMCRFKGALPFIKSVKEFPKYLEMMKATEIN